MDEPIAVVGLGCRFAPNVETPNGYWAMLTAGRDGIGDVPLARWGMDAPADPRSVAAVRRCPPSGAYIQDVAGFDAAFFGISPREAVSVDPQQRMMLELAWEALERAGIPPTDLRRTETGVFMAATCLDYGGRLMAHLPDLEPWAVNGSLAFGISNRISYALDLRGPSMTVDTACAGSLTAIHLACMYLWRGEASSALAGGVNVASWPGPAVALAEAGATAADGRSKAFDSAADGYGRGDGAGVVVLKRLSDAERDGDQILALVRGSGDFHDGTGAGFMVPNGEAQEHMLRQVYARAGITPESVSYVETHGTGTPVGDPIEAEALSRFFGAGRLPHRPCLIGSAKPNIGHLEAGAGVAALIKVILALRHRQLPPSLHTEITPAVDWATSGLRLVPELMDWPEQDGALRAGISGFGVGGSLAHLIVEQPTVTETWSAPSLSNPRLSVFPLSSRSEAGTRELAGRLASWLDDHPDAPTNSIGATLARRRSHLEQRAAVVASDAAGLARSLRAYANGCDELSSAWCAPVSGENPVWVFSGHGAEWEGMGRKLLDDEPVFAEIMDRLAPIYQDEIDISPREAIADGDWTALPRVQAMIFAMQVGLAEVWADHGMRPGAVIGHSLGEIAAAVVSGALELDEAARFVCRRGSILASAAGPGAMAMVDMPFAEATARVPVGVTAAIAASPTWTVVSGDTLPVEQAAESWRQAGHVVRRVDTTVAFHSSHMDAYLPEIVAAGEELLTPRPTVLPLYSTVTTDPRSEVVRDGRYWGENTRNPVLFANAVAAAVDDGHRLFVEVSSHPIVAHSIEEVLDSAGITDALVAHSLRRNKPELEMLLENLASLHCHGAAVDWTRMFSEDAVLDLPTMAWQRRPYWLTAKAPNAPQGGHNPDSCTLVGAPVTVHGHEPLCLWQTRLDYETRPYPGQHRIHGVEIMPAAVFLASFMAVGRAESADALPALADVDLRMALTVDDPRAVQIVLQDNVVRLASRAAAETGDELWTVHASARISSRSGHFDAETRDSAAARSRCRSAVSWTEIEQSIRRRGLAGYGFGWQLRGLWSGTDEFVATITTVAERTPPLSRWASLLDGALTVLQTLNPDDDSTRVLAGIEYVGLSAEPPDTIRVHGTLRAPDRVDMRLVSADDVLLGELTGIRLADLEGDPSAPKDPRDFVHRLAWRPRASPTTTDAAADVALIGDDHRTLAALRQSFAEKEIRCVLGSAPEIALEQRCEAVLVVPCDAGSLAAAAESNAWTLIRAAQAITRSDTKPRLWCVTRGVRTGVNLAHAALWGVARIIAGEHPEFWGGLVDVDPDEPLDRIVDMVGSASGEDIIAVTADGQFVPRLESVTQPARPALRCGPDATYLVTGGLGTLGLKTAGWLADRGARRIILAGRHGLPSRKEWDTQADETVARRIATVRALEARGVTVRPVQVDVTDADALATTLEALDLPPVRGVVHAAGVVGASMLMNTSRSMLAEVMGPKVRGALALDHVFPAGTLDFFVQFSSAGQLARITGQTAYAAANAFLDTFAAHRRVAGCHGATSIAWTSWLGDGMSAHLEAALLEAEDRGFGTVTPGQALQAWEHAARFPDTHLVVTPVLPLRPGATSLPVRDDLSADVVAAHDDTTIDRDWRALPDDERFPALVADLCQTIAAEFKIDPDHLDVHRPLAEAGLDSVLIVRIRTRLNRAYGVELPPTLMWERPTVHTLATYLNAQS
ncbi:type I polyketide synthase [Nocardia thraciensis]